MGNSAPGTTRKKVGRPTIMDEARVKKLEEAFAIGCSDEEACFYADISKQTLYTYQDKHPGFVDRKESLKNRPVLLARQTVVSAIAKDSKLAMDFLKAKKRDEFATKTEVENSGETAVTITYVHPTDTDQSDTQAGSGLAETQRQDDK